MNKELLRADLKRDEGFRSKVYTCPAGKLTVGYGRNLEDVGISEVEAEILLADDIEKCIQQLDREYSWWVKCPDDVQRGLVNMAYNLGIAGLGGFKKMLACLQAGDYGGAATHALDSVWVKQVGARAQRIAGLFRSCATSGEA